MLFVSNRVMCGFRVGFVSKYIPLLLDISFLSLPCQCVYTCICKSDFVNVWTSEICVRLIRFLNRTISNSVKLKMLVLYLLCQNC